MAEKDPLLRICALLNKHAVRYLVIGGHACILHGLVRTTEDVDLLIEDDEDNFKRIIAALSELEDHAAAELSPKDFQENVVVKIADEVEVDVSRSAWKVSFEKAIKSAIHTNIDGVRIPYVDLETLIATKETFREQDIADVSKLRRLLDSSAIVAVEYDNVSRVLGIQFRGGDKYRYFDVSLEVYRELTTVDSAGAYWNSVKDNYKFERSM